MKAMEALGYVERKHLPGNKKNMHVFLTRKGKALKKKLVPLAEEINDIGTKGLNRPLKKWASNASGTLFSKKRVAQTRLRSDCTGQSGLFAGHLAHFGRTYPRAHA